jgi:hypothetical protein
VSPLEVIADAESNTHTQVPFDATGIYIDGIKFHLNGDFAQMDATTKANALAAVDLIAPVDGGAGNITAGTYWGDLTEGNGHREGTIVVAGQTFHWTTDIAAKVIGATEPPVGGITYLELGDNRSGTFNSGGVGFSVSNSKKTMLQACLDSIKTQIDASSWDATTKTNAHTVVDQLYNNPPASGAGTITTSGTIQTFDWSASSEFEVIPSGDINQPSQTYIAVEINIAGPQGAPTLAGSNGFVTQQTNNRPSMIPPPPGETQDGFYTNRNTAPSDTVIRQSALTKAVANLTNQINASALSSPQKTSALSALTAFQGMIPDFLHGRSS